MTKKTSHEHRRDRFCNEYVVDFNGKLAAMRVGIAQSNAANQAWKWMKLPEVKEKIRALCNKTNEKVEITAEQVIYQLACIAKADAGAYFKTDANGKIVPKPITELSAKERAAIAELHKGGMKLHDKLSALDKLGKHFKLFTELHEQTHTFTVMNDVKIGGKPLNLRVGSPPKKV